MVPLILGKPHLVEVIGFVSGLRLAWGFDNLGIILLRVVKW